MCMCCVVSTDPKVQTMYTRFYLRVKKKTLHAELTFPLNLKKNLYINICTHLVLEGA